MGYRRTYRGARRSDGGSRWLNLRRGDICAQCGCGLQPGALAYWDAQARTVTCAALACRQAIGEAENQDSLPLVAVGLGTRSADTDGAPVVMTRFGWRRGYEHTGSRCEDAPCCGCC